MGGSAAMPSPFDSNAGEAGMSCRSRRCSARCLQSLRRQAHPPEHVDLSALAICLSLQPLRNCGAPPLQHVATKDAWLGSRATPSRRSPAALGATASCTIHCLAVLPTLTVRLLPSSSTICHFTSTHSPTHTPSTSTATGAAAAVAVAHGKAGPAGDGLAIPSTQKSGGKPDRQRFATYAVGSVFPVKKADGRASCYLTNRGPPRALRSESPI